MTSDPDSEALKGMILDRWIDDLRNDRRPRTIPGMESLGQDELEELMRLARWYKASFFSSQSVRTDVDSLAAIFRERVCRDRAAEFEEVAKASADAVTFGSALQAARARLDLGPEALEQAHGLAGGAISQLEAGKLPPHRIPIDRMVALLRGLRLSEQVLDVIRRSCFEWAASAYGQAPTQLGRIDASLKDADRLRLLQDAGSEASKALAKELERIGEYCSSLEAKLR